jgi:hypothetical protein
MRYMCMLIVGTAMVFVAAGSARGISNPGPLMLGSRAVAASALSSLPAVKADESLSKTVIPAAPNFTVGQLFVVASAEDGKGDDEKNPRSRSAHCPPDKDDHHDINYRDDDHKGGDNQDKDKDKDKDKDHHDNCGKGDDGKNP